jgi:hypothetical protein
LFVDALCFVLLVFPLHWFDGVVVVVGWLLLIPGEKYIFPVKRIEKKNGIRATYCEQICKLHKTFSIKLMNELNEL